MASGLSSLFAGASLTVPQLPRCLKRDYGSHLDPAIPQSRLRQMRNTTGHRLAVAILMLVVISATAQAHVKPVRRHHRTATAAPQRLTTGSPQENTAATPPMSLPLSWLLVILAVMVAIAFVAFTGMLATPQHAGSPQTSAAQVKWHY